MKAKPNNHEVANFELSAPQFTRLANNFYIERGISVDGNRYGIDAELFNYINKNHAQAQQKYKVALCFICLNEPYWQYAANVINQAKVAFLPGHDVDMFLWSDMKQEMADKFGATVFPTDPMPWPIPTLYRYHLMLQQEEVLSKYDYVFYMDVDMAFVNIVGDEVLGSGLTAALHPGYAVRKEYIPPYEPNSASTAFIPRPGRVIDDKGQPRFMPMYYAGGFQGGKSSNLIKAAKVLKDMIDRDIANNYVAIWNDESHWNKYLFEFEQPDIVLTPAYIYPDSLIEEYYKPLWGKDYPPRLVTLTKKFSTSTDGGAAVAKMINETATLRKQI